MGLFFILHFPYFKFSRRLANCCYLLLIVIVIDKIKINYKKLK